MFPDLSRTHLVDPRQWRRDARLRVWARSFAAAFAVVTLVSMLVSAEWRPALVFDDPLAWLMLILAAAAGVSCGYALGCRIVARKAS